MALYNWAPRLLKALYIVRPPLANFLQVSQNLPPPIQTRKGNSAKIFGAHLEESIQASKDAGKVHLIVRLFTFIDRNGIDAEDVLITTSDKATLAEFIDRIDGGEELQFDGNVKAYLQLASGLLHYYLLMLPDPLVPCELFSPLINVHKNSSVPSYLHQTNSSHSH